MVATLDGVYSIEYVSQAICKVPYTTKTLVSFRSAPFVSIQSQLSILTILPVYSFFELSPLSVSVDSHLKLR